MTEWVYKIKRQRDCFINSQLFAFAPYNAVDVSYLVNVTNPDIAC